MSKKLDDITRTKAVLDGLDELAAKYEKVWGVDRLRLLVGNDMRERFDQALTLLNEAILEGRTRDVEVYAQMMKRGWDALDQEARSLNAPVLASVVWEVRQPSGKVAALVKTEAEARSVSADSRYVEVWTLDEIGRLIEGPWKDIGKVKEVFPGALVTDYRKRELPNDDIPF